MDDGLKSTIPKKWNAMAKAGLGGGDDDDDDDDDEVLLHSIGSTS